MVTELQMVLRLILAVILGGIIGFEREWHEKAAGLRTHILVCLGACLMMLISIYIFEIYKGVANVDPSRIASMVVTGIGFLGAGTIIRSRVSVIGLTTAASLWAVAGVGLAVGVGLYTVSMVATVLILMSLIVLSRAVNKVVYKKRSV